MKINRIRLSNGYKRFHDTTIDLGDDPPRIVALVGQNGCGKSSVFDGMLFLKHAHGKIGSGSTKSVEYHSAIQNAPVTFQDIELQFGEFEFSQIHSERSKNQSQNTIFSFRSPYRYNSALKVTQTKATEDIRKNSYGANSAATIDEKMEENYRRLTAKYNTYRDVNDTRPSEAKAHIIGELNDSIRECLDIEIVDLGNVEANKGSLYFSKYDQPKPFEFDVLSSGEKEVVDILLDLYLRAEDYTETIFLIDEPELHISTAIQKKLLIEINKLIGDQCQIWIATHSIGLLRALQDDLRQDCEVIYFEPGTKFASEVQVLKPMQKSHANWRRVFATALDDLSELVSPKTLVYCEGKDRPRRGAEDGLDARVYNTVFGGEFPEALFVSSGGNTELDQRSEVAIKILSKVLTDLSVLVFKDRDFASGKPTTEDDRQAYLAANPDNHRVMVRWEIENYLFDKEVLRSYCGERGHMLSDEEYDSLVTDIINQDVKSMVNEVKALCGLQDNEVSNEGFKLKLAEHLLPSISAYEELKSAIFT